MNPILEKYADLLVHYCLEVQEGERLYIRSTQLAEPLVREVFRLAVRAGAIVEVDMDFREKYRMFLKEAQTEKQLSYVSTLYKEAMQHFDAYLYIRAPYNLREDQDVDSNKAKIRQEAHQPY